MPLTETPDRELLHARDITIRGYLRADGLVDVEAHIVDTKAYGFDCGDRGVIEPGVPLHGMWVRLTVDSAMVIVAAEAVSDYTPWAVCPGASAAFGRLVDLTIRPGFLKQAALRIGGTNGCTHQRELLQQIATVAFQSRHSVRARAGASEPGPGGIAALIDSCHAYSGEGSLVRERWPEFFTAQAPTTA